LKYLQLTGYRYRTHYHSTINLAAGLGFKEKRLYLGTLSNDKMKIVLEKKLVVPLLLKV